MNFSEGHIHTPKEWRQRAIRIEKNHVSYGGFEPSRRNTPTPPPTCRQAIVHFGGPFTRSRLGQPRFERLARDAANGTAYTYDRTDGHAETTGGCGAGIGREKHTSIGSSNNVHA